MPSTASRTGAEPGCRRGTPISPPSPARPPPMPLFISPRLSRRLRRRRLPPAAMSPAAIFRRPPEFTKREAFCPISFDFARLYFCPAFISGSRMTRRRQRPLATPAAVSAVATPPARTNAVHEPAAKPFVSSPFRHHPSADRFSRVLLSHLALHAHAEREENREYRICHLFEEDTAW